MGENDRDRVEADFLPLHPSASRVGAGGPGDVLLFFFGDGAIGCAVFSGASGFHLDEDESFAIAGDNVHFRFASRRAIVAGHDPETCAFEIAVRQIFPATAERLVGRHGLTLAELPRRIT